MYCCFCFVFFLLLFFFLRSSKVLSFNLKNILNRVSIKAYMHTAILRYALTFLIHGLAHKSL